jgi:hypothetical protein
MAGRTSGQTRKNQRVSAPDELDRQRTSAPVGSILQGTVTWVPSPAGVIGVGVDLDLPARGFVDVLELPLNPDDWPTVGHRSTFEVLQHRRGEIRLSPTDEALRRAPDRGRYSAEDWADIKARYPVGSDVEMTVTRTFHSNRECSVEDGRLHETVEWSEEEPSVGAQRTFRVERHLDSAQRVILELRREGTVRQRA